MFTNSLEGTCTMEVNLYATDGTTVLSSNVLSLNPAKNVVAVNTNYDGSTINAKLGAKTEFE